MAAGDAIYVGTTDWSVVVAFKRSFQRGEGWRYIYTYEGPETGRATKEAALYAAGAITVDGEAGTPSRVTATFPDTTRELVIADIATDTESEWTLEPFDISKTLGSHGIFDDSSSVPGILAEIDHDIRAGTAKDTDYNTKYGLTHLNSYRDLACRGVREWDTSAFVLRRSVVVSNRGQAHQIIMNQIGQAPFSAAGTIVTWDEIRVPLDAGIQRPSVLLYFGAVTPIPTGAPAGASVWKQVPVNEWRVKPPRQVYRRQGKVRKRQIDFEWIGAVQWSGTLYLGGSGSP